MDESNPVPVYFSRKMWPIRIVGGVLLVLAGPLILLLVVLVRCSSPGPGLFRQARVGRGGKEFCMYKIRTMYRDAEAISGPVWCKPADSRITPVGRFLRWMHLDELPQLINVVRGEMDLVGPRPERPEFVRWLAGEIPQYHVRLSVLPGVTGLAQINLPPDETVDCVRKKLVIDCQYIEKAGVFLDARILACTFLRMIGIRHGRAASWLGLTRRGELRLETQQSGPWISHVSMMNGNEALRVWPTPASGNQQDLALVATAANGENGHAAGEEAPVGEPSRPPLGPK